jgi:hypothetical protein
MPIPIASDRSFRGEMQCDGLSAGLDRGEG